jgi:hypothetical protein
MGVAYFIVLDNSDPGFDTFVNGKAIARHRGEIYGITNKLGLKGIDDLTSFGGWDEELDAPEENRETITPWFDPQEGIDWVAAIRQHIEANNKAVTKPHAVLTELREYEEVLQQAATIGAKWHFEIDV